MIQEWSKFKGWVVLEYFLLHPNNRIHINELSRTLGISLNTVQKFCTIYHKDSLLEKTQIGNIHQYFLNEDDTRIKILKRLMGPYLVVDNNYLRPFLKKNKNVLSISVYGSFASGEYGSNSDLDILILTIDEQKLNTDDFAVIETKLEREVTTTSIAFAKWRAMERKKDRFFLNIKKNNVLVWGSPI